ncbi:hypothetical protein D7D52_02095 [Nocardia yunnanensis]|uniref:Secreted protein n=1 Tax=Nocardia yunnanensis TaxID=2382165 RepID=A0A386Z5K2_9NOCA|nr:hypothetical protein D7D52_02095 [Nocardia yunnanensis]
MSVAIALAAVGAAWNAPAASAEIGVQLMISDGVIGTGFGTGCTYSVVAYGTELDAMSFYDNGLRFAVTPGGQSTQVARWTPTTVGTHEIKITQSFDSKSIMLTVGTGLNAGSVCQAI